MTLIAFAAEKNRAHLMTDSAAYRCGEGGITSLSLTSTKLCTIPSLDAVMTACGPAGFTSYVESALKAECLLDSLTFDDLVRAAPATLRHVWGFEDPYAEDSDPSCETAVFLLGYSVEQGRFTAHIYPRSDDFAGQQIDGLFVRPAPFGWRPSVWESDRAIDMLERSGKAEGIPQDDIEAVVDFYYVRRNQKDDPIPSNAKAWRELAVGAREYHDTAPFPTIFVGGDVYLTTLSRGESRTRHIHRFVQDQAYVEEGHNWREEPA